MWYKYPSLSHLWFGKIAIQVKDGVITYKLYVHVNISMLSIPTLSVSKYFFPYRRGPYDSLLTSSRHKYVLLKPLSY